MESKYILEVFDDYLKTKETNFALLINGAWGSGKTYFWKNSLVNKINDNELKPIYISLNGLDKIDDLKYNLLIKLIPILNKLDTKKGNLIKSIISTLSSGIGNININDFLKEIEIDSKKLSQYVICFDDLERCYISKDVVLGFINNYVEHKNLKVIILSNEKEIEENKLDNSDKDNISKYHIIKEKVIGRILNYENSLDETLSILFEKHNKDIDFKTFLDSNKIFIYRLLSEYKVKNLRHLFFFIENLKRIYPIIKTHTNYTQEVVFFTLLISLEFKEGNLNSNDYNNYKQLNEINPVDAFFDFNVFPINSSTEDSEKSKEISYSEKFHTNYLSNNIELYFFYESIYKFILTGYLDNEKLTQELNKRYPIETPAEIKIFQSIATNNYLTISDEEFKNLSKELLVYAEKGVYRIYDYLQISNFYNFFIENKLIDLEIVTLNEYLIKGIHNAKQKEEVNTRLYNSLFHFNNDTNDKEIIKEIKKAHEELLQNFEKKETHKLIESIDSNNIEELEVIFETYTVNPKLFELVLPESLFNSLINCENKTLFHFNILFKDRYNPSNIADYLSQDKVFLNKLNSFLLEYIQKTIPTVKIHNLKELNKSVTNTISKLEKS